MVIPAADFHDIPGVAVFDALFRIGFGYSYHAPDPQGVAENLHRLGDPLADAHALAQGADDLVGIRLLQLVVADAGTDKIMNIPFLLPLCHGFGQAYQLGRSGAHRLLMFFHLSLVK